MSNQNNTSGQLFQTGEILGISKDAEYKAGDIIFREGEDHDRFYIILEGRVAIKKRNAEGADRVLSELGPGEFFGENVLLGKKKKPATAQAVERTRLLAISYESFQGLLKKDASVVVNFLLMILEVVGNRLSHSNKEILALNALNRLMGMYQDDASNLARAAIEQMLALTESDDGAVFLHNPYSKTYRTIHSTVSNLNEKILKKIDPSNTPIMTESSFHYLSAVLGKMGAIVLRKDSQKRSYTDDDLRLLILVAEQLTHTLESAAARAEEKARKMLHEKRFAL